MSTRPVLSVFLLLALSLGSMLALASDLYTGESALAADERAGPAELARALDEVLVRLTGEAGESLVDRFGLADSELRLLVLSEQRVRRQRSDADGSGLREQVRLQVDFDPQRVDALLAERNLPRLGRERPSILLWLAVENAEGIGLDADPVLEAEIAEQGRRLGLDIVRPLGDLQDLAEIEAIDIRGGFLDSAEPSARRYGAGLIAMLDLRQTRAGWEGRWFWRLDGLDAGLHSQAPSRERALSAGLERLLATLVDRFGVLPGLEGGTRRILVEGIDEEVQYVEVLRYLSSLSVVADLRVVAARDNRVDFELDLTGPGFEDALAIGAVLDVIERREDGALIVRLAR